MTVALRADGTLTLLFPGQPLYHLQPQRGLRYAIVELAGFAVEFRRDAAGTVTQMDVVQRPPQPNFTAVRVRRTQAAQAGPPIRPGTAPQGGAPPPPPAPASPVVRVPSPSTSVQAAGPAPVAPASSAPAATARPNNASANAPAAAAAAASCDALAAHPDDDGKPTGVAGAADEVLAPARAIPACTQTVQAFPKDGRLHFQLGRAYWAAKRHGDAIDSFLKAEELGYAPAYFYLAEAYDYGLVEGEKADADVATALYGLAAEGGFLPAKAMLGLDTGSPTLAFDPAAFARPGLMKALRAGDVATLNKNSRAQNLAYLSGMHALLRDNPKDYGSDCASRTDPRLTPTLDEMAEAEALKYGMGIVLGAAKLESAIAGAKAIDAARQDGVDDMHLLVSDYGGCSGEAFERIYATIWSFARSGQAPAFAAAGGNDAPRGGPESRILNACYRFADNLTGSSFGNAFGTTADLAKYCQCVAPKIAASALSQSDREAFTENFDRANDRVSRENPEIMKQVNEGCAPKR